MSRSVPAKSPSGDEDAGSFGRQRGRDDEEIRNSSSTPSREPWTGSKPWKRSASVPGEPEPWSALRRWLLQVTFEFFGRET